MRRLFFSRSYKYLAFSHVALGEERAAERQSIALLSTDPAHPSPFTELLR